VANKELKLIKNLKRLFSNNVVIRHAGGKRLNLVDTDREQITTKRFSNIKGITRSGYYPSYNQYRYGVDSFAQRMAIFNDYEKMDAKDPILSSALDVVSDEATVSDEQGDILKIISDDNDIKEILENLFFDILNIDYNL